MDEEGLQYRMRLLFIQETDWIKRYPAQQHHLAEMMALRGHEIRVIDHDFLWREQSQRGILARRQVFNNVSKIHKEAKLSISRPHYILLQV